MKFTKVVRADWENDWFDVNYYLNQVQKALKNFHFPFSYSVDGNKIIIEIKNK